MIYHCGGGGGGRHDGMINQIAVVKIASKLICERPTEAEEGQTLTASVTK